MLGVSSNNTADKNNSSNFSGISSLNSAQSIGANKQQKPSTLPLPPPPSKNKGIDDAIKQSEFVSWDSCEPSTTASTTAVTAAANPASGKSGVNNMLRGKDMRPAAGRKQRNSNASAQMVAVAPVDQTCPWTGSTKKREFQFFVRIMKPDRDSIFPNRWKFSVLIVFSFVKTNRNLKKLNPKNVSKVEINP